MSWGDTARIDGGWSSDPCVVAICPAADCPVVGARIAIGRDEQGRYVARWSACEVGLHAEMDRDARVYVTREGVEGLVERVRPVRPEPRFEAYVLWLRVDADFSPPAVLTPMEPDHVAEDHGPVRNDF